MEEIKIEEGKFESLFPFLILLFIGFIRFIKSKKKTEESRKKDRTVFKVPPPFAPKKVKPHQPSIPPKNPKISQQMHTLLEVKKDAYGLKKRKKTRIQRLVSSAGGKRKIILLSEILKHHES